MRFSHDPARITSGSLESTGSLDPCPSSVLTSAAASRRPIARPSGRASTARCATRSKSRRTTASRWVTEHGPDDFAFDRDYLGVARSDDLVIIQLTVSGTRGLTQKKALFAAIAGNLAAAPGLRPQDVLVILGENRREDWSFGDGVASYVA